MQGYDYPGEIFTDLHTAGIVESFDQPDLPVDDVKRLHKEMNRAAITYYTGKQLYLKESQPYPSDVLMYSFPDSEDIEYQLLGRDTDSVAHYWRDADRFLEVTRYRHTLDGDLEEVEDDTDRFSHLRATYLERYVDRRDWDILREPDYSELQVETCFDSVDVPDETEQASFSRFGDGGETG